MELKRATIRDANTLWKLQVEAFADLLEKYQDYSTSPANETIIRMKSKLRQPYTYFYYIVVNCNIVGAIRIIDMKDGSRKRIAPIFILKKYRNRGYAQSAIRIAEDLHGQNNWKLDTILQEAGNCHLYEKIGYIRTGQLEIINDKMTLVYYEKD